MANSFDLPINPLSGSTLEVKSDDAGALTGTEKVLVVQSGIKETTTQAIADLGGGSSYLSYVANLSQVGAGNLTGTPFTNSINFGTFERYAVGGYEAVSTTPYNADKLFFNGLAFGGGFVSTIPLYDSNGVLQGYVRFAPYDSGGNLVLDIETHNSSHTPAELSTILTALNMGTLSLPEIRVYP